MAIRRISGILFCMFFAAAMGISQELSLEEILKKNEAALGGAEAIAAVKTLKVSVHMTSEVGGMQMDGTMVIQSKRPNMVRSEMTLMGNNATTGSDGTTSWMINPMSGSSEPQKIDPSMSGGMFSSSVEYVIGSLSAFKASGYMVESAGREDISGVPANRIKVTFKNGNVTTYFLDSRSFLAVKTISRMSVMGQTMEVEGYLGDFKKVGDIMFAHTIEQRMNGNVIGKVIYDKVEVNTPMDDAIFKMPVKEAPAVKK